MKYTLLLLFFNLSLSVYSQTVTAKKQGWSGGVCCRSGMNYYLTITCEKGETLSLIREIDSVSIDGMLFEASQLQINQSDSVITIHFGYSQDEIRNEYIREEITRKTELANKIYYKQNHTNSSLKIPEVIELFYLAYP